MGALGTYSIFSMRYKQCLWDDGLEEVHWGFLKMADRPPVVTLSYEKHFVQQALVLYPPVDLVDPISINVPMVPGMCACEQM